MKQLGDRLRDLREARDLKQTEASALLGINNKVLSSYERNISVPTIDNLKLLCEFYNVSADYLLQINLPGTKTDSPDSSDVVVLTSEQKRVLSYYTRLSAENKEAVKGLMILYYKEQLRHLGQKSE